MIPLLLLGVLVGTGDAPKAVERPIFVRIHPESKTWTPHSLRVAGDPNAESAHRCQVRRYPEGDDTLVVVACFPKGVRWKRRHLEARFVVIEGWLEEAKVASVIRETDRPLDSVTLRREGLEFQEQSPGKAQIRLAAFDLKPGGLHAGTVKGRFSWGWRAELPGKKPAPPKPAEPQFTAFTGSTGYVLSVPAGWQAEARTPEAVEFTGPAGESIRLEVTPFEAPDLEAQKKRFSGEAAAFPLHLPAFQVTEVSPPRHVVVVQGKKSYYVFSTAKDHPAFQQLIVSLTES